MHYNVQFDKLRIPSTKRFCIICQPYGTIKPDTSPVIERIEQMIKSDLTIRSKVEPIKNCTNLPREFLAQAISLIAKILLDKQQVHLSELPKLLGNDITKVLKSQCGGLQTLLRNHKHVFEIRDGMVMFAVPQSIDEEMSDERKLRLKQKQCWFYFNHPDGCPLTEAKCCFVHSTSTQ
jgi:tRNASer (uridine44-2'-O)-methyltransferase